MLLWSVSLSPIVFHIPYYPSHQKKAFISVFIILNFIWKHKECSLFVISHYINQDSSIDNPHFFYFPVETPDFGKYVYIYVFVSCNIAVYTSGREYEADSGRGKFLFCSIHDWKRDSTGSFSQICKAA